MIVYPEPSDYNMAMAMARAAMPNRAIAAFQPTAFAKVSYPVEVVSNRELVRYVDCMHESRAEAVMSKIGALTQRGMTLAEIVVGVVADISEVLGRREVPRVALLSAIPAFREILARLPAGGRVFEFGPGSGYLGAMLLASGALYSCTDVSQAFFLYQQRLFHELAPGEQVQIPWWRWAMGERPAGVAVVTANHCLREMYEHALRYNIKAAGEMLANGGVFVVDDFGAQESSTDEDVRQAMVKAAFSNTAAGSACVFVRGEPPKPQERGEDDGDRRCGLGDFDAMLEKILGDKLRPTPDEAWLNELG